MNTEEIAKLPRKELNELYEKSLTEIGDLKEAAVKASEETAEKLADLEATLETAKNNTGGTITDEVAKHATELVAKLKAEIEEKDTIIREQNEQITLLDKIAGEVSKTAEYEGKTYRILFGVNLGGKVYTADQIAANDKVIEELVESGSGALELIS